MGDEFIIGNTKKFMIYVGRVGFDFWKGLSEDLKAVCRIDKKLVRVLDNVLGKYFLRRFLGGFYIFFI